MGAGGYVSLTNGTPYFFKLRKQGNLNMNHATWPDTVPPCTLQVVKYHHTASKD